MGWTRGRCHKDTGCVPVFVKAWFTMPGSAEERWPHNFTGQCPAPGKPVDKKLWGLWAGVPSCLCPGTRDTSIWPRIVVNEGVVFLFNKRSASVDQPAHSVL